MEVLKFGGTSVGSAERVKEVVSPFFFCPTIAGKIYFPAGFYESYSNLRSYKNYPSLLNEKIYFIFECVLTK